MNNKLLAELEFSSIIAESTAQTATGSSLLDKYKSYLMAHESTCRLVNNFISEASKCQYDNGVHTVLEKVSDYIQCNKTSWALASVCENLKASTSSYNYLNRPAIKQVEKLLENDEETINKYIKAGALKNVMYVTEFRNIAKQVYHDMPMIESTAEYTLTRPISMVQSSGDGYLFEMVGKVFQINNDHTISEATWNDVSNTFKTVSSLLESDCCKFDEVSEGLTITYNNVEYFINECGNVQRNGKKMTVEQFRDNNRLVLMSTNPRFKNTVAGILEAIALTAENFDNIAKMDNCAIYETKSDRFAVICEDTNMYATLLNSTHRGAWTCNSNVIEVLEFIKDNTRANISELYNEQVKNFISEKSEEEKEQLVEQIKNDQKQGLKERIEALTEKFKDDPTKLAILSQVAQDLQNAE